MARKTTASDVARLAGVSASTVDRVLNNRGGVTEAREKAVLAAARRLGLDRALNQRAARTLRIAVMTQPPSNPFHAAIQRGFEQANRSYPQFNMQFRLHHIDPARGGQTARRIAGLAANHDGIVIVSAYDADIAAALSVFTEAGKPVITLATDMPGLESHRYIGPDNYSAGRLAGTLMGRFLGREGGAVMAIAGMFNMVGQQERVSGFQAVLRERHPACHMEAVQESLEQGERAGELVYQALRRNPSLRGVYNASAGAQPVVEALKALGRQDVVFITHELTPEYRSLLKAGLIDAIIDQDPAQEVRTAVETLGAHFGRAEQPPASLITPVHIHLIENC
ncbi:LacI family DNA-binding transcriptional regulator [Allorhizobium undicola]|uniref:LacI family DNA-binding transcriptional regulator n=1 Tax=Allorhizobium undicola TaxID=78527 RepID=UPI003D34CA9E